MRKLNKHCRAAIEVQQNFTETLKTNQKLWELNRNETYKIVKLILWFGYVGGGAVLEAL